MDVKNDQDLMTLFDRLTHGGMKDSIKTLALTLTLTLALTLALTRRQEGGDGLFRPPKFGKPP